MIVTSLGRIVDAQSRRTHAVRAPDVLVWRDVPMPEPGPGQVRIRVKAAGVMPTDVEIRRGELEAVFPLYPDAVLGFEAAGVVDALGPSVSGVTKGNVSM
jgi:NADPH:quinone reductase-like Zn-dependent oxidoreductase